MKIFLSVLLISFVLLVACKKESDPEPAAPTKTELMTASVWKVEDAGFDQDKNGSIEFSALALLPGCVIDNTISFKTNNTGLTDEGGTKCNIPDLQTTPFNWSFADNETNINISNSVLGQMNGKSKVVVLTATNMTLAKDTTVLGTAGWAVVKLKH